MRVVGLVSGGKDSCYNMMQCVAAGHTIVALANIQPNGKDELDSYMYQTVGHQGISIIAEAMGLPLFRRITKGHALEKGKMYQKTDNDEVEDLYELLKLVKEEIQIEGVAVGAILSDYQRVRVENVCSRLGLVSLAYLWRRDQTELLQEMIDCQVYAIVIKVAALGLEPSALGRPLRALQPQLLRARDKFGLNVCGEGGEYETFTLDCPLFKKRIVVDETQVVIHSNDPIAPAGYMNFLKLHLVPKSPEKTENSQNVMPSAVKTSLDYISDLNESCYSDLSDIELSESELENAEDISKARRQSMSESTALNPLLDSHTEDKTNLAGTSSCPSVLIIENSNNTNEDSTLVKQNSLSSSDDKKIYLGQLAKSFQKLDGLTIDSKNEIEKAENQRFHRKRTNSRNYMSNPPSPIKYECEKTLIEDTGCIFANNSGWHWIGGIVGEGGNSKSAMENAVTKLCSHLASRNLSLSDICSVTLYVRSMEDYADLNAVYVKVLSIPDPPARVCVQCPLPEDIGVILEAVVHKWPNKDGLEFDEMYKRDRHTMHVQGISHWAPANIGPYSQAVRVGDIIYLAGQIPLVPGSMILADSDGRAQCRLALRHVQRLLNAMDAKTQIRDVVQAVCYLTHPLLIGEARRQWERRTNNAIVDYVVVPRLPRDATLEWHVWAHRHNSRFEYEETGCHVGEYKVAIRRRWNYENNVAAVVCYVATGSSPSTSQLSFQSEESFLAHKILASQISEAEIIHILEYCTRKLLRDYQNEATVGLRIFYKVASSPDVTLLINALRKFRSERLPNLAFTVIPVIHLQNAFTFLSISAIRHESD